MPNLKNQKLVGNTGLKLPVLGLGVATQGNLFTEFTDAEAQAVFTAAWQAGIRFFDTAPRYGLGLAEQRLCKFLKKKSGYVLSTKVGCLLREDMSSCDEHHVVKRDTSSFKTPTPYSAVYDTSYDGFMHSF